MTIRNLDQMLAPSSVVFIGASPEPSTVGNKITNAMPGNVSSFNFVTTGFTTGDITIDVTTAAEQAKVVGTTTYTAATDSLKAAGTLYINLSLIHISEPTRPY